MVAANKKTNFSQVYNLVHNYEQKDFQMAFLYSSVYTQDINFRTSERPVTVSSHL